MVVIFVVAWVLLQQNGYKFKIIFRELESTGLWEPAAGCVGCCQAGSGRTGVKLPLVTVKCTCHGRQLGPQQVQHNLGGGGSVWWDGRRGANPAQETWWLNWWNVGLEIQWIP